MNTIAYFEIQSSKPVREIEFYKNVFGWRFAKDTELSFEYYRIETPSIHGAILERPAKVPPQEHGTNAFTCSIMVENFDETERLILENGGQTALPKFAIAGKCWQGYFMDEDNNVFGIFEVDEHAK